MREDLDFTKHFSEGYTVPEPVTSEELVRDIDKLGLIGVNALKDQGYFTRIVVEHRALAPKLLNPQNVRVLIVDDDEATGKLIELTLHAIGCKTRRARNRQEIAQGLAEKPLPHLVLLDILLPDANGFDILAKLRQVRRLRAIPVIMLTAQANREDVLRGITGRASGYITKPFENEILITAVKTVLGLS